VPVKDIRPGSSASGARELVAIGDTVYFRATNTGAGTTLWKSDGSEAGTVEVSAAVSPSLLTRSGGTLYFQESVSRELWKSDRTPGGTVLVEDIDPAGGANPIG
jgi:ELWxxDGT repeat protein